MINRENFGTKIGAVFAAAGSAVGLGNIWRFPIETGRNGGAAFILVYIACIVLLGLPVMLTEFVIGRDARSNAAGAFRRLAPGTQWKWVGRMGVFAGFVVLSYYSVVAGWTVEYAVLALGGQLQGRATADFPRLFADFSSSTWQPIVWLTAFLLLTHYVIVRGVTRGIERSSRVLMPALFVLVAVLVVCAVSQPGAGAGLRFLLQPDFTKVTGATVLNAMGQAFFSLSLGLGCLCTYASYFGERTSLARAAVNVCAIDTVIALMAGFIIFPAAASAGYGLSPEDIGPSLIFITLPGVFQQTFGGVPALAYAVSVLFYLLLILAALTSTISMHEIVTSYVSEEYGVRRSRAATIETVLCVLLGSVCALSFGAMREATVCGMTVFDLCDWTVSKLCMPLGALSMSVFVGWYADKRLLERQITNGGQLRAPYLGLLRLLLRYVTPVAILAIFLNQFGLF